MLDYNAKMTAEESAFAEEHHGVVFSYLSFSKLPVDEFYDIAIFGYLRAVRKYLARSELREQYKFSTIAYRAMSCDVYHSREYLRRARRLGIIDQLDHDHMAADRRDTVAEAVNNVIDFEAVVRQITPTQRLIASLRADGYHDREIAAICGIKYKKVAAEMEDARHRILMFQGNDAAVAA